MWFDRHTTESFNQSAADVGSQSKVNVGSTEHLYIILSKPLTSCQALGRPISKRYALQKMPVNEKGIKDGSYF